MIQLRRPDALSVFELRRALLVRFGDDGLKGFLTYFLYSHTSFCFSPPFPTLRIGFRYIRNPPLIHRFRRVAPPLISFFWTDGDGNAFFLFRSTEY